MLVLVTQPQVGLVSFLRCGYTFLPLSVWPSLERISQGTSHTSFRAAHLYELFGILLHGKCVSSCPFIYWSNHFSISVWTHGNWCGTLGYNLMLLSLFCCSDCYSFSHWEFFCLPPVSLWQTAPLPHLCGLRGGGGGGERGSVLSFQHFLTSWHYVIVQAPGVFPAPAPEPAVSPRNPGSFCWKISRRPHFIPLLQRRKLLLGEVK